MNDERCKYDPTKINLNISMHHCPLCGEMVMAGLPHINYKDIDYEEVTPKSKIKPFWEQ
jgi:hypothetical protein